MSKHALLSASSSSRWIACPPSVRLSENIEEEESVFAKEGSECHELCAVLLYQKLQDPKAQINMFQYENVEMQQYAIDYVNFIFNKYQEIKKQCSDAIILIEQELDFSDFVKDGFGTGDCVIVADGTLHIIDFKYGQGVLVESIGNTQMMCYALGAIQTLDCLYDFDEIEMTIYQPRKENISSWTISKEELLKWAKEVLKPAADLAYEGKGEFKIGEHCRFCKAKAICRKRAEHNLALAKYDFKMPDTLEDMEISTILKIVDDLVSWANDVKEYALDNAIQGKHYEGFKLVKGRATTVYSDPEKVINRLKENGINPYIPKIAPITELKKLLGNEKFNNLLGDLLLKKPSGLKLVPESDKREEYAPAQDDFNDNTEVE